MEKMFPAKAPAIVRVKHKNGFKEQLINAAFGDPTNPMSQKDLQEKFLEIWNLIGGKFSKRIDQWSESSLDRFKLLHPLLGRLTLREMLFFTIFHNEHHLRAMKLLNESLQKI